MDDFLSDQDEWDTLGDETIKKTYGWGRTFEEGERVMVESGDHKSIKGRVIKVISDTMGKIFCL